MSKKTFRGIRPDDLHGRMGLRNPERGLRTEMYFSNIPGEIAGLCSCHSKQNKLDGRSLKPVFQNIEIPGVPHLIRGNRLDAVEFAHHQWMDELDFLSYDGVTIMQSYCFLMKYDDGRPLPQEKLDDVEEFFLKLRQRKVKALLRFAYELSPTLSGPSGETILKHLSQLAPLIRKYIDVIYVLQCGFVGKFGEWHNSYYKLQLDVQFRKELMAAVLEVLPPTRMTMMRYPKLKMDLFGYAPLSESEAFTSLPQARIGHFNDGFMAGPSNGGTFGRCGEHCTVEQEMAYLEQESRFLPMDGELFWRDLSGAVLPAAALKNLNAWHYDTLGMVHAHSLFEGDNYSIDVWKMVPVDPMALIDGGFKFSHDYFVDEKGKHVWRSYYEYIRDHLGYRLELLEAEVSDEIAPGKNLDATVKLINRGFSAPVNPRPVKLVLSNGKESYKFRFKTDIRKWEGHGTEQTLTLSLPVPEDMAPGKYKIGFALPDGSEILREIPEYAIQTANPLEFKDGVNWLDMECICK